MTGAEPQYRFDFHNRDGSVDCYDLGRIEDVAAARKAARAAMLVSQSAQAVEIWREQTMLDRLRRNDPV